MGPNTEVVSHGVVWVAMKIATISGAGLFDQRATTGRLMRGVRRIADPDASGQSGRDRT